MESVVPLEDQEFYPERIRKADVREIVVFSVLDVSLNTDIQKHRVFAWET